MAMVLCQMQFTSKWVTPWWLGPLLWHYTVYGHTASMTDNLEDTIRENVDIRLDNAFAFSMLHMPHFDYIQKSQQPVGEGTSDSTNDETIHVTPVTERDD